MPNTSVTHLECSLCSRKFEAGQTWNLCECGGPLLVRYDLALLKETWSLDSFASAPDSMWRYAPVLPVQLATSIISLGEGMTPLLPAPRTGARIGAADLLVKDDGLNPTAIQRQIQSLTSELLTLTISKAAPKTKAPVAIPTTRASTNESTNQASRTS